MHPIKGAVVAWQWAMRMHGFDPNGSIDDPLPADDDGQMRELTDLEQRLTAAERERASANVRPKDAATLMIVDRSGATPKVLLGKRHHGHKFMPGKFVFPGGRLEPNDRLHAGRNTAQSVYRTISDAEHEAAERGAGAKGLRSPRFARRSRRPA